MSFDFDQVPSRHHTNSIKWDFVRDDGQFRPLSEVAAGSPAAEVIPMGLSDMDFPAPPAVSAALAAAAAHGIFGYTRPDERYYQAISSWMAQRHQWLIQPDWILTTSGTMSSIILAIQTVTEPGEGIIIQPPLFGPIGQAIANNERRIVNNPLLLSNGHYAIDYEDLAVKAAEPDSKMLILCHPHNPVGRVWRPDEIRRLGMICRQHDLILVADEIHGELCYSWAKFWPVGQIDATLNERLIVCTGPSKAFNLPGLHTSLAIIPAPELRQKFRIGQRNNNDLFSHNMMGMLALQAAYESGGPWLDALLIYLEANYLFLRSFLQQKLPQIKLIPADGLYLAWLDCRDLALDETGLIELFLKNAKVDLEWGSQFGEAGIGFVRLNLACPRTLLSQSLERIRTALT